MGKLENIFYVSNSENVKHQLDVYVPEGDADFPVLIFIHGGSWYNGCKEMYRPLGKNMAQKDMVSVIINYRLGGEANYIQMAHDCAAAIKWTYENIHQYKGKRDTIFVAGHSAGGHLSALVTLNQKFFAGMGMQNPLKGCILIDAFGLNIDYIMFNNTSFFVRELQNVFTKNPDQWKEAAPVNYIKGSKVPFLILIGSRTYPYLTMDNEVFRMNLEEYKVPSLFKTISNRNHVEMITSLQNPSDLVYQDIISFVNQYSYK